jgi:REP element-mobilizing transposase RayT
MVFSTKGRTPDLTGDFAGRLFAYMGGIVKGMGGVPRQINGPADHVHLLVSIPAKVAVAEFARVVKANSSKWAHGERGHFEWQSGYGAFSVSSSNEQQVREYIATQEEHHRHVSFQEEYQALLTRHGVEFDPRDVLD